MAVARIGGGQEGAHRFRHAIPALIVVQHLDRGPIAAVAILRRFICVHAQLWRRLQRLKLDEGRAVHVARVAAVQHDQLVAHRVGDRHRRAAFEVEQAVDRLQIRPG